MHAIAHELTSTRATSLMRVKIACTTSAYETFCVVHWHEENKRKNKTSSLIVDCFSLTIVNLPLA